MARGRTLRIAGVVGACLLVAVACSDDGSSPDDAGDDVVGASDDAEADAGGDGASGPDEPADSAATFPGDSWDVADPEDLGFAPERLQAVADEAQEIGSNCLLVARQGQIAGEWYWNDTAAETPHEAFSVTKSYTSALVGIAQDDGDLDISEKASDYIGEWVGTPSEDVTIRNLLSGDSGLHAPEGFAVVGAEDATEYGIALNQDDPPGTVWANNEPAIQTLEAVMAAATGEEPAAYAEERLLDPIGARNTAMGTDPSGNTYMFWNLQTTCRDAARFGYLFLRNGNWDGTQVVPEDWVAASTGESSQGLNPGYGYLWWLNRTADSSEGDAMVPDAPQDMYWALGAYGQVIQVDSGSETVVVRFGDADAIYDTTAAETTARVVTDALDS